MARIIGGIGTSHVPTIGDGVRSQEAGRPGLGAVVQGLRAGRAVAGRAQARRAGLLLQRPRDHVFLRPLSDLRARRERASIPSPTRAWARARCRRCKGTRRSRATWPTRSSTTSSTSRCSRTCRSTTAATRRSRCSGRPRPTGPGESCRSRSTCCSTRCPTPLRCYKLGQAVRRAVESWPEDLKVVVVGTGGLSHQLNGERAGFNNTEWDLRFLDLIERDPRRADRDEARRLHRGSAAPRARRCIMWLAMRGALSRTREEDPPELLPADDQRDGRGAL